MPSAISSYVGHILTPVKSEGMRNLVNDMLVPTKPLEDQFEFLRETFDCLHCGDLLVNLPKLEFSKASVDWLGMVMGSFGVRPASSRTKAISHLSQPATVVDVRVFWE